MNFKKKAFKRMLALLLCATFLLSACGENPNVNSGKDTNSTPAPTSTTAPSSPTPTTAAAPTDAPTPEATETPTPTPTSTPTPTPDESRPKHLALAVYYTDEDSLGKEWKQPNIKFGGSNVAGNDTKKILCLSDSRLSTEFEKVISEGECTIEYIVNNAGSPHGFMILDSNKNVLINVGGAKSGNLNMMPEDTTSGVVSQWIASVKSTWVKVNIVIDLDNSNATGVLDFVINFQSTDEYKGKDTIWTEIGTYDEAIYVTPGGQNGGANAAPAHPNGAATMGFNTFDFAGIKIINGSENTVYIDDLSIEATGMKVTKTLKEVKLVSEPSKKEYKVGSKVDLAGLEIQGVYEYAYADGVKETVKKLVTDYEVEYNFDTVGEAVPVTIKFAGGDGTYKTYEYKVAVRDVLSASYIGLEYKEAVSLSEIGLSSGVASVHSGSVGADDNTNESKKIKISKGTAKIEFDNLATEGKVHFETEFLTKATSKASLFFRIINSEGLPLIDIGQYGSSNLNMYLDRATSGDFAGQFKGIPVKKWCKAIIDIDLDASKAKGHLVFTAIIQTTENYAEGGWTEFARFDETLYLNSTTLKSATGAASTQLTKFDVAGIEFTNAGGSDNFYDNLFFEAIGAGTEKTLTKLEIVSPAAKTEYIVGDAFNNVGLVLKGIYEYTFKDGSKKTTEEIVNVYDVAFDNTKVSDKSEIVLSKDGQKTSFYVKVKANEAAAGLADYIVKYINNNLVVLDSGNAISLGKRNVKLPLYYGDNGAISYEVASDVAAVTGNILTVIPSVDKEQTFTLVATLDTVNADGDSVKVDSEITVKVPKASTNAEPTTTLVSDEDFKAAIQAFVDNGVISGQDRLTTVANIMSLLNSPIKTEEFVAMLLEIFDVDTSRSNTVISRSDINYDAWYVDSVVTAFQLSVEAEANRKAKNEYGIGDYLSAADVEYLIERLAAIDKRGTTANGYYIDTPFELGLPAQADSKEHLVEVLPPLSDMLAFPGADGYAKNITGGRGGKVIHVTNLNSTGEGSLLAALDNNGDRDEPRIIVFDVAGTIDWTKITSGISNYKMTGIANVTIAGQTAPGEGITLTNGNFYLYGAKNVIIRFIHFRHGQATGKDDSAYIQESQNIMIDHCSFTHGSDESMSARNTSNLTIQWSIIADGVRTHSMGGLQEWNSESILHCLFANNNDRNPKAKGILEFTNNVLYNWGQCPYVAGGDSAGQGWGNVTGNYFIAGLDTRKPDKAVCRSNGKYMLYLGDNLIDSNKNGVLDGVNTGIDMIDTSDGGSYSDRFTFRDLNLCLITNPMSMATLNLIDSAEEAYYKVMKYTGASVFGNTDGTSKLAHDDIDRQILNGVMNQTGKILLNNAENYNEDGEIFDDAFIDNRPYENANDKNSPYYASRLDSDGDGMPDVWETAHGLNPSLATDGNSIAPSGYTWVEEYLNELAAPAFPEENLKAGIEAVDGDKETTENPGFEYDKERTYILQLEKNGTIEEYALYHTKNNLMAPLAPVLEYVGYIVTKADEESIVTRYPYALTADLLAIDTVAREFKILPGVGNFGFSTKYTNFNDAAKVYNGMIYVPISMFSLANGVIFDQVVTDKDNNVAVITIHDAEVYKNWHTATERVARKTSAPSAMPVVTDSELRILFDKEVALVENAKITVTDSATGKSYSMAVKNADLWGSNKVVAFEWSALGMSYNASAQYTVTIDAAAFADYYKDTLKTDKLSFTLDAETVKVVEVAAPANQESTNSTVIENTAVGNAVSEADAVSVKDAIARLYELAEKVNVNKMNYDVIK